MDISLVLGPPPPGTDLSDNRTPKDNAVVITVSVLAIIIVALRFFVRARIQRSRLEIDDWLISATLIPLIALLIMALIGGEYGLGKHVWRASIQGMVKMKKILFAYLLVYLLELFMIKISILMFYRRIFGMNWMTWACLFCACGWMIGSTIAVLTACQPIAYFWTSTVNPYSGHERYNFYYYYIGNGAANVVTDFLILLVPLPIVWRLHMRTIQKVMVCSVFLLGGFVCVASIVRLHFLTFLDDDVDITWNMGNVYVWSTVEACLGIVCACLPTIQPFLRSVLRMLPGLTMGQPLVCSRKVISHSRRRPRAGKRASNDHGLQTMGGRSDSKPNMWDGEDDEAILTTRVEPDHFHRNKGLEDEFGLMSIRVKHDFHWTVDPLK
ncbi:hypothetical protein NUU61_010011 [Penicillium alfredii]|uniref:Rhodopsin domain-containing protein n=1 Tax=Penicillium alfredii TaxID=1506179 RepID=A0A9W9EH62_9EURO|nr:uncharacterized protein NUU61_010011 [Penicillium alfredii]KAJ5081747.1 hypothetical protein NUU61_010011 [Penicillium alfredii]